MTRKVRRVSCHSRKRGESSARELNIVKYGNAEKESNPGVNKRGEEKVQEVAMKVHHRSVISRKGDSSLPWICGKERLAMQLLGEQGEVV